MSATGETRTDKPIDPYLRDVNRVQDPMRMETLATSKAVMPEDHIAAVIRPSALFQTIPNAATTKVTFNTLGASGFDPYGIADLANSRFVLPSTGKVTGLWVAIGKVRWTAGGAGVRVLGITKAGVIVDEVYQAPSAVQEVSQVLPVYFHDPSYADAFELYVVQNSGGPLDLNTSDFSTSFSIFQLW